MAPRTTPRGLAALALVALAWPASPRAETSVVLFPAIGRPTLVTVAGRVTHGTPEEQAAAPLERNAKRLLAKSREHLAVSVSFAGQVRRVVTGDDGVFEASFPAPGQAPFAAGLHEARAEAAGGAATGKVQVVSDAAPFLVVSDLDDTLAVTNVQSVRGVARSALLADERTQPAVEGMAAFFRCLGAGDPPPGFAIVSGTPFEFAARVEAFLAARGFPFAAVYLRHLGPGTMKGYKEPALRALLSRFPQRVVLVGDSGERDPEVYAKTRSEFPDRVAGIFIRDVGRSADPARFEGMVLFKTAADAAHAAAARGLVAAECADAPFPPPGR
jgi:phosphatidate phosphatase APP1